MTVSLSANVGGKVLVQFVCRTGGTDLAPIHDPNQPPDDRVRPSHAAFHGKVFDPLEAPYPPLDYGCRCAIRYVTEASDDLPSPPAGETETEPITATQGWLDVNVSGWADVRDRMKRWPRSERIDRGTMLLRQMGVPQPRMISTMVADVLAAKDRTNPALQAIVNLQSAKVQEIAGLRAQMETLRRAGDAAALAEVEEQVRAAVAEQAALAVQIDTFGASEVS